MTRLRKVLILRLAAALAWLVDRLAGLGTGSLRVSPDVLVVRLDAIGDFLLWSDAACRLADHYHAEGRRVLLLANASWAELAETLGVFDSVWPLDRRRFLFDPRYRFVMIRRLRQAGFALAIQPTFSRELLFGDAIMRIASRRTRIGYAGDLSNMTDAERRRADGWYSHLVPAADEPQMELERNAAFLIGLGISAEPRIGRLPVAAPRPLGHVDDDYFVLFPGASWDAKCWPPDFFAALAERITAATGWHAVLAGASSDRAQAAAVVAAANAPLVNQVGATNLNEFARLLAGARLVISNDTSAVHLAAVVGTPSVCILGGGHFGRFLPYAVVDEDLPRAPYAVYQPMDCYGCNWACRYPRDPGTPFACIKTIGVEQVWTVVRSLLPTPHDPA
ncbi:glycosyltransferase family 9 protein [Telmatospirillum sp.]|uniref:glycosyltransferase family 9 protein n=1 Tax=Telmatospirillum sp. TaxID=2079197 RepID=UPI00283BA2DA|nr:glycosyltransferase family 9 protein [Telmatospirillum sp.]MDR3440694.1 glycosyltransferase family 9 protein [Telmatospirillum sp.]